MEKIIFRLCLKLLQISVFRSWECYVICLRILHFENMINNINMKLK